MANLASRVINGARVLYDSDVGDWRLIDGWGPNVTKALFDFSSLPTDDTSGLPTAFTTTLVNASTAALSTVDGGSLILTTAGATNDGVSMQLKGESFQPKTGNPIYFGIKFQVSEATQSDFLVGLCITDTALLAAVTDGIYFRNIDGATSISTVTEKDSGETETSGMGELADTTDIILEIWVTGTDEVKFYINGAHVATHTITIPGATEVLTPSVEFLTGDNSAETMLIDWMRVIQINT